MKRRRKYCFDAKLGTYVRIRNVAVSNQILSDKSSANVGSLKYFEKYWIIQYN